MRALGYRVWGAERVLISSLARDGSGRWQATVLVVPPPTASYAAGPFFIDITIAKRSRHWRAIRPTPGTPIIPLSLSEAP